MTRAIATSGSSTRSRLLAELLERVTARVRAGEPADFDGLLAEYPEHAEELRRLMPAVQLLADLSRSVDAGTFPPAEGAAGLPGEPLGDYRLIREVGRGGMGVVYEAEQISLGRRVALKVLPFAATMDPRQLQRFYNEAKAAASLHHEHIVPVYAVGCERGVHYYAMQFIDGTTLADVIGEMKEDIHHGATEDTEKKEKTLQSFSPCSPCLRGKEFFRRVAEVIDQAADALEYAHSMGVVHRDVKPGNLMVDTTGKLWVTDFGLARFGADAGLTMTGDVLGTLRYMAPEQALAKHNLVDHRADIYGLGATLYELLTGQPAIAGEDRQEILRRIAFEEPVPPRKLNRSIPPDLETIALKCLAKEPAERYASAADLAADLRRWLDDKPIRARLPSQMERLVRWMKRRPALAALTAVSTLALVALAVFAVIYGLDQRRAADRLASEQDRTATALASAQLLSAGFALDRGQALCDEGEIGKGTLWMVRALELAPADAIDLRGIIRLNLACWQRQLSTLRAWLPHDAAVKRVNFSDDGRLLLTLDERNQIRVWDSNTNEPIGKPWAVRHHVNAAAFSPDSTAIFAIGPDGIQKLGRVAPSVRTLAANFGKVQSAAFSPDRRSALLGNEDGTIRVVDVASGKTVWQVRNHGQNQIWTVAWSPDGQTAVTGGSGGVVKLWDGQTGAPRGEPLRPPADMGGTQCVAWRPDGRAIVAAYSDFFSQLWDVGTRQPIGLPMRHTATMSTATFSPDGRFLVTGGHDKMARVWDGHTGQRLGQPMPQSDDVRSLACSPDARTVAAGGADGVLRIWDVVPAPPAAAPLKGFPVVDSIALSPDSRVLLAASVDGARVLDAQTGRMIGPMLAPIGTNHTQTVAFTRDGRFAMTASGSDQTQVWDAATYQPLRPSPWPAGQWCAAISSDGQLVLTGNRRGAVQLWNVATGDPAGPAMQQSAGVCAVAFGSDTVAAGCEDGALQIWDAHTGQPVGPLLRHPGAVVAVCYRSDRRQLLSATTEGVAYLWDVATGDLLARPFQHQLFGRSIVFSADGQLLLHMTGEGVARLRDIGTGKLIGPPIPHAGTASMASFRGDGRAVATLTGRDGIRSAHVTEIPEPVADDAERNKLWVQTLTGMELERDDVFTVLDRGTWQRRRQQLEEITGRRTGG